MDFSATACFYITSASGDEWQQPKLQVNNTVVAICFCIDQAMCNTIHIPIEGTLLGVSPNKRHHGTRNRQWIQFFKLFLVGCSFRAFEEIINPRQICLYREVVHRCVLWILPDRRRKHITAIAISMDLLVKLNIWFLNDVQALGWGFKVNDAATKCTIYPVHRIPRISSTLLFGWAYFC